MDTELITSAELVGMFCRLHMNTKRDIPVKPSEMGVLIFIQKQTISVTPLMISQFFRITKPSVTTMVNNLINLDYLIKEPSASDRRSYTLRITKKGNDLVKYTFNEYFKSIVLLKEKMGDVTFNQFIELIQIANSILEEVK